MARVLQLFIDRQDTFQFLSFNISLNSNPPSIKSMNKEDNMQIPNVEHIQYVRKHHSGQGFHHLNFRKIYEAINRREDFSETQLFYLGGLVDRKLKTFDSRLNADYLEAKP